MDIHFEILTDKDANDLFRAQEEIYKKILYILGEEAKIVLIGGTALARCYLQHRVSFDLDFAVDPKDDCMERYISRIEKNKGFSLIKSSIRDEFCYDSAFFHASEGGVSVEFSLIQDRKYSKFKIENKKMGVTGVVTASLDTLYYNKLRAVAGDSYGLGRDKIRDIFDIVVLSKKYLNVRYFIDKIRKEVDRNFSESNFYQSIIDFNWLDISDQCIYFKKYSAKIDTIDKLIEEIHREAGLSPLDGNYWEEENEEY